MKHTNETFVNILIDEKLKLTSVRIRADYGEK